MDSQTTGSVTPAAQKRQTIRELLNENLQYLKVILGSSITLIVLLFMMLVTRVDGLAIIILLLLAVTVFCVSGTLVNNSNVSRLFRELDDIERLEALKVHRHEIAHHADI